ncbi:MAG: GxxExxY protein [Verrucomicrobiales bacterium]
MKLDLNELPHVIVGSCMEVHRALGPGLPVDAYRECLDREFRMRELVFERDSRLPIAYKGETLESRVQVDFIVEDLILLKVVAIDRVEAIHKERVNNYLRMSGLETGFLINFNVVDLRQGIKRLIVSSSEPAVHYR